MDSEDEIRKRVESQSNWTKFWWIFLILGIISVIWSFFDSGTSSSNRSDSQYRSQDDYQEDQWEQYAP